MHEIQKLKDMLCKELEVYGQKGELTTGGLDVVDKLAHAIKNLDKIIDKEDEYSGRSYGSYANEDGAYAEDGSYARGRGSRRDSMGRYSGERGYSRGDNMVMELRNLMQDAPDDMTRKEFQKFISKLENM